MTERETKSEVVTLRVTPSLLWQLQGRAANERRTVSQVAETILRKEFAGAE